MIRFWKMVGAGNDFVVLDNRDALVAEADKPAFARRVCPRAMGVGADGVLFVEPSETADYRLRIFNPDGSEAEMCGNGARCAARFAHAHDIAPDAQRVQTLAGVVTATLVEDGARVGLPRVGALAYIEALEFAHETRPAWRIDTGVPHVVVSVDDVQAVSVRAWGRAIRTHPDFAPAGANADFLARGAQGGVDLRTYERGVEDETLACGTGAVAAALVAARVWGLASPVTVRTRSGESLRVHFRPQGDAFADVALEGPVRLVYRGELA